MPRLTNKDRAPLPKTKRGEHYFLVMYDTPNDSLREKLSQACLESGLLRVQQSCFMGCIRDRRAQELWSELVTMSTTDGKDDEPQARISVLRLDQAQLWPALHMSSPVTELTSPKDALRPKRPQGYMISVAFMG